MEEYKDGVSRFISKTGSSIGGCDLLPDKLSRDLEEYVIISSLIHTPTYSHCMKHEGAMELCERNGHRKW